MKKHDELTDPTSCFNRAHEDELIFVLLGHSAATAETIRFWCQRRIELGKNKPTDSQIIEALKMAEGIEKEYGTVSC